jgi:NAD(P)-dependent dehydrogenase (short-subunit alcohol dehydrogenase family)
VGGVDCEVSSPASVQRLADAAVSQMGSVDVWINNAGYSGTYQVRQPPLHCRMRPDEHAAMHAFLRVSSSLQDQGPLGFDNGREAHDALQQC